MWLYQQTVKRQIASVPCDKSSSLSGMMTYAAQIKFSALFIFYKIITLANTISVFSKILKPGVRFRRNKKILLFFPQNFNNVHSDLHSAFLSLYSSASVPEMRAVQAEFLILLN